MAAIVPLANAPAASNPQILATHPFTCNTCQVAFRSSEQQRHHMHSDWHRYNLKRKIAQLPPISSETFAEKVLHAQAQTRLETQRANFEKKCHACDKTYYSENAFANHVGSLKHRQNLASIEKALEKTAQLKKAHDKDETESVISSTFSMGEPIGATTTLEEAEKKIAVGVVDKDITAEELSAKVSTLNLGAAKEAKKEELNAVKEDEEDDEEEDIKEPWPVTTCLFCHYESPTLQLNVSHMGKAHGLFIPEQQYLVDLEGLIRYLSYKIGVGHQCIYCNKPKGGLEGVRVHMKDKQHCRIPFETEDDQVELGDFYDFRPSYEDYVSGEETEDEEDYEPRKKGLKPNFSIPKEQNEGEDEGWETDSSASSLDSEDLCAVPIDHDHTGHGTHLDKPRHHKEDGYHVHAHAYPIYHDEYELHLPSGRSVGRRQLARYYRQHTRPQTQEVTTTRNTRGRRRSSERRHSSDDEMPDAPNTILSRRERRAEEMGVRSGQLVRRKGDAMGLTGVSKEGRREITRAEKRGREVEERGRRRFDWGVEKRGNMQKHFRDPLLQ
ncbi:hypothetical protein BJ508DRAFT_331544 [Ascobolus immersus RN42]|uniref:C2H2-type domain-containing protein n=1 Tax=Ascobolus immersus RN42 TaxID=1160509 RepID=A0A3N4HQE8_ASCIM|nr:hypothetical protein BJ508DRAFT_331544 [Ascobolus immersus RN42]